MFDRFINVSHATIPLPLSIKDYLEIRTHVEEAKRL